MTASWIIKADYDVVVSLTLAALRGRSLTRCVPILVSQTPLIYELFLGKKPNLIKFGTFELTRLPAGQCEIAFSSLGFDRPKDRDEWIKLDNHLDDVRQDYFNTLEMVGAFQNEPTQDEKIEPKWKDIWKMVPTTYQETARLWCELLPTGEFRTVGEVSKVKHSAAGTITNHLTWLYRHIEGFPHDKKRKEFREK